MPPRFYRTPAEVVAKTARETVRVGDHTFLLDRPADPDAILDYPWGPVACADGYVPYWPILWSSARLLAAAVLREPWEGGSPPPRALEIGCGLGLAGCACLARGLHVTFSDVDVTALVFAEGNARLNGFAHGFRTHPLDIRSPPRDERFDVVIGSDLMYEERLVNPLVALLDAVLAPGGLCLIADPDRLPARSFHGKLLEAGYDATVTPSDEPPRGIVYRIRHQARR